MFGIYLTSYESTEMGRVRMKRQLLTVLFFLLIIACAKSIDESTVIDESTLIEKDALMYLDSSEVPFEGVAQSKYSSGEILYTVNYINGMISGEHSFLNKDGSAKEPIMVEQLEFRNETIYAPNSEEPYSGTYYRENQSGQKILEGIAIQGKREGRSTELFDNGTKKLENFTRHGLQHGKWSTWYENGNKKCEGEFHLDKKNGIWSYWLDGGQIDQEMFWVDGKNTRIINYTLDGKKLMDRNYSDGKKHGKFIQYYPNGQIEKIENYYEGEQVGPIERWNEEGHKIE